MRRRLRSIATATLLLAALGVPTAAFAAPASAAVRVVAVQQISRDTLVGLPGSQPDTQVEPDLAVSPLDPTFVVAAVQQGRYIDGGSADIGFATSHDGGRTWRKGNLPHLTLAVGGRYERASDPSVTFGPDGAVYIQSLVLRTNNACFTGVVVQRSDDGGRTFTDPFTVQADPDCVHFENDKNWIVADTYASSPHRGRIYSVWDRVTVDSSGRFVPQVLRYSDDRGNTWSGLITVSPPHANTIDAQPLVSPSGAFTDVYRNDGSTIAIVAQTSYDGGRTFTPPVTVATDAGRTVPGMRTGVLPAAAVDRATGELFVTWQDPRYRSDGRNDVLLSRSPGGRIWTSPIRVNADPVASDINHFTPDVAAWGGHVIVTWRARAGSSEFVTERFATSADGGRSFGTATTLGPAANLNYAAVAHDPFFGDYMGTAASHGVFYAAWCRSSAPPTAGARYHQTLWGAAISY